MRQLVSLFAGLRNRAIVLVFLLTTIHGSVSDLSYPRMPPRSSMTIPMLAPPSPHQLISILDT